MKKFFKSPIAAVLVLALVLPTVLAISAEGTGSPQRYDPFNEGIVSSYYHIDRDKGFITGIAPGTTFDSLPDDFVCPLGGVGKDDFEAQ